MKMPLNCPVEKFYRAFDKKVSPATFLSHFTAPKQTLLRGRRRDERFVLYRHKKNLFSLFSLTLRGKVETAGDAPTISYTFSRPPLTWLILFLWCATLLVTGLQLIATEPGFALEFLLPGILFSLPLFLFSKKEKAALEEEIKKMQGTNEE